MGSQPKASGRRSRQDRREFPASPASLWLNFRASGVEGEIGRFRRNHLVPVPEVASLAELNAMIDRWDVEDDQRRIGSRVHTVAESFAIERPLLRPLPEEPFATGRMFSPRVDRYAQVTVRMNRYSVKPRKLHQTGENPQVARRKAKPARDLACVGMLVDQPICHRHSF